VIFPWLRMHVHGVFHNCFVCRMVITLVYYGLSLSAGELAGNRYINNFLSGVVEIPAYTISFFILGRWVMSESYDVSSRRLTTLVAWWGNGRVSDLRSWGRGFDSRSGHYQVVTTWMGERTCKPYWYRPITNTKVNSAFHPSGVDELSIGLSGWG